MPQNILPGLPNTPSPQVIVTVSQTPLKLDEKGIILSSPVEIKQVVDLLGRGPVSPKPYQMMSPRPNDQEIRHSLLFWDKIHLPEFLIPYRFEGKMALLKDEGVLLNADIRPPTSMSIVDASLIAREKIFRDLEQTSPSQWALAEGIKGLGMPSHALDANRGLLLKLFNVLPVPDDDVNYEDLLEFRAKYKQSRIELRGHIERAYDRILNAADRPLTELREMNDIRFASNDMVEKLKRSGIRGFLADYSASFHNLGNIAAAAIPAYAAAGAGPLGSAVAAAAGVVLTTGVTWGLKKPLVGSGPYQYVARYHHELRWAPKANMD